MAVGSVQEVNLKSVAKLPKFLVSFAWLSFILNVLIIGTGGAVRLTGSGLGCTDWPLCTPDSLVTTPEMGIHGIIEFGNRTISGPLLLAAVVVWILSFRIRAERQDLMRLATFVLVGVLVQAFIGGVVVWMHLNANLVGVHYALSVVLVCVTTAYLVKLRQAPGLRIAAVPKLFSILVHVTTLALAITVIFGIMTTAAGPHSGDAGIERRGFDATVLSHIHAWPGYILGALLLTLLAWSVAQRLQTLPWLITLTFGVLIQIVLGVYQSRNGLPPLAVGIHMVVAALTCAAMIVVVLKLRKPATID